MFSDPNGLAYIAERLLNGLNWWLVWGKRIVDPLGIWTNTDFVHQQIFFEDGQTPNNTGKTTEGNLFYSDSVELIEDTNDIDVMNQYKKILTDLDDALMRAAVKNVGARGKYCLIGGNCQSFIDKILSEYYRLEKEKSKCLK